MFKKIKEYFSNKKQNEKDELYRSGFGWAMARFYCDKMPIEEIYSWSDLSKQLGYYNEFDKGIEYAIEIIEKSKLPA